MKIRITQKTPHKDEILFPGTVLDVTKKQADEWIKAGLAIAFGDEQPEKEEVKDGG